MSRPDTGSCDGDLGARRTIRRMGSRSVNALAERYARATSRASLVAALSSVLAVACSDRTSRRTAGTSDGDQRAPAEHALVLTVEGNATLECNREPCRATYPHGTRVSVASTTTGMFATFSGDCVGSACELVLDADRKVAVRLSVVRGDVRWMQHRASLGDPRVAAVSDGSAGVWVSRARAGFGYRKPWVATGALEHLDAAGATLGSVLLEGEAEVDHVIRVGSEIVVSGGWTEGAFAGRALASSAARRAFVASVDPPSTVRWWVDDLGPAQRVVDLAAVKEGWVAPLASDAKDLENESPVTASSVVWGSGGGIQAREGGESLSRIAWHPSIGQVRTLATADGLVIQRVDDAGTPLWEVKCPHDTNKLVHYGHMYPPATALAVGDGVVVVAERFAGMLGCADKPTSRGLNDVAVLALDAADGRVRWSRRDGYEEDDYPVDVGLDAGGAVVLVESIIDKFPGETEPAHGPRRMIVTKLDGAGRVLWERKNTGYSAYPLAAAVAPDGASFVVGTFAFQLEIQGQPGATLPGDASKRRSDEAWLPPTDVFILALSP
ncbi:MAG: hypothetical protein U0414_30975 [Polyangiaceae bacterium]